MVVVSTALALLAYLIIVEELEYTGEILEQEYVLGQDQVARITMKENTDILTMHLSANR